MRKTRTVRCGWLLGGLLAACGGGGEPARDVDAADLPDPPDAAPPAPVTVTVYDGVEPQANQAVVFYQGDGTLVANLDTDGDGQASAVLEPGGIVVVPELSDGGGGSARALYGLQPGDQVELGRYDGDVGPRTFVLTVPVHPSADTYQAAIQGSDNGFGVSITSEIGFFNAYANSTADIAIAAFDDANVAVGWLYAEDVDLTGATVELLGAYQDPLDSTLTLENLDEDSIVRARTFGTVPGVTRSEPWVYGVADGESELELAGMIAATGDITGGARGISLEVQGSSGVKYLDARLPLLTTDSFDVGAHLPPAVGATVFDAALGEAVAASIGAGDIGFVILAVGGEHAGGVTYSWQVQGPPPTGQITFRLPELPSAYASLQPAAGDFEYTPTATFYNADEDTLDALRCGASWTLGARIADTSDAFVAWSQ